MTVADILDGGLNVIKTAPRTVLVIAATFVIPLELVSAWLSRDQLADRGFASAVASAFSGSDNGGFNVADVLSIVLGGLVLALVTGAIAHLVSSWYADRPASAAEATKASLRHAPALLVAWVLVHVIEGLAAVALFVPLVFVMPLFMVTSPAIVTEHLGPFAGMRRSWTLTRGRYGSVLGAALLIAVVDAGLTIALGGVGLAFSVLPYGWVADVACQAAASLVTVPFVAGATTLTYLDLRIRVEGLDLELDIAEHFASAG
jgi:hypothetical protein